MARKEGFAGFEAIFGEVKSDIEHESDVLFHAYAVDSSRLRIFVTNFRSNSWDRVMTVSDLEDLRDDIGIGGNWNEFLDYLKSSLSTGDVKIIQNTNSNESDVKLVAFKSKGLPRISLSLNKTTGPLVSDAIANFSLSLFHAFKHKQNDPLKEQERSSQLMQLLSSEKEKNEILQKQLDSLSFLSKRKVSKPKLQDYPSSSSEPTGTGTSTGTVSNSDQALLTQTQLPADQVDIKKDPQPAKVTKRVAPVSRRPRVRGVSLKDNDED
ncbi:hypothetical protein LUZ60_015961 [Juncus effusus]|nr:hypothetical protein LUZ60_015961 [Juncus effusus]